MNTERRYLLKGAIASILFAQSGQAFAEETDLEAIEDEIASSIEEELRILNGQKVEGLFFDSEVDTLMSSAKWFKSIVPPIYPEINPIVSPTNGFRREISPLDQGLSRQLRRKVRYWRMTKQQRVMEPRWPKLAENPDLFFLSDVAKNYHTTFSLDWSLLKRLMEANAFPEVSGRILIGFRGAQLVSSSDDSGWAKSHEIRVVEPNHINFRCLVGVCNIDTKQIRLFRASTVPQTANMFAAMLYDGLGTSLLPTGFYKYISGTHKQTSKYKQPGALRRMDKYIVLRTPRVMNYDPTIKSNVWSYGYAHNIHAAGVRRTNPLFDSAGCQVIPGGYYPSRRRSFGAWHRFQEVVGLVDKRGAFLRKGVDYNYVLLTGMEAAMAYNGGREFAREYRPLRPGSVGPRVEQLQKRIYGELRRTKRRQLSEAQRYLNQQKAVVDGKFDTRTGWALLLYQKEKLYRNPMGLVGMI